MLKRGAKIFMRILIAIFILWLIGYIVYSSFPDGSEFKHKNPKLTAVMRQRIEEARKAGLKPRIRYIWVPLSRISPHLIRAVILSEDARFYQHHGFDFQAIKLAAEKNWKRKRFAYGGSTITQQVARNLYLSTRKSLWRKFKELIIAYRMENALSKRRILELYLNIAEWGRWVFGAEAASRYYYHKHANQLTLDEAVRLAVILPSPIKHSPYDGSRFVERRRRRILYWMYRTGYISKTRYLTMIGKLKPDTIELDSLIDERLPLKIRDMLQADSVEDGEGSSADKDTNTTRPPDIGAVKDTSTHVRPE